MFEAKTVDQETEDNSVNCTLYASGWNNEGIRGSVRAQLTTEILTTVHLCAHSNWIVHLWIASKQKDSRWAEL